MFAVRMTLRRTILLGMFALLADLAPSACSSSQHAGGLTNQDGGSQGVDDGGDANALADADAKSDASGDASGDASADAPAKDCLDDKVSPTDGGDAGTVCPSSGPCSAACARILDRYKAGVAQAAAACILALPSCGSSAEVVPCVDRALARACPDPTSPSYCAPLVTPCDSDAGGFGSMISEHGCESFANGLAGTGRQVFAACIRSKIDAGTCATEVGSCADDIRQ